MDYVNQNVFKPLPQAGLISPADHKVVQIEITNRCFMGCSNCTRLVAHQAKPFEMDRPTFDAAVRSVADHPGMIGIMGGEPTLHSDFEYLVRHYAATIDPGRKYRLLREPVADLATYRNRHCGSLHHKRGLWSATGPRFLQHLELISETFGYWCLNDHSHAGKHQALLVARNDLGIGQQRWEYLRDRCWLQRTWSSSITPAGAYFCEVAAAIDWTLFGGRLGWPIKPGWWKRKPADFGEQLSLCEYCAAPLEMPARLPAEEKDDVSPTVARLLLAAGSPRVAKRAVFVEPAGEIQPSRFGCEAYMRQDDGRVANEARVGPDNPWVKPREIVGLVVCVDFSEWLPEVLEANKRHFDRYAVVTTPADTRTQEIAAAAGVDVVLSERCYDGDDAFNKGKMLNDGLQYLQPSDWVLLHDADVLLAPYWGEWIRSHVLNPGCLYHAQRLHAMRPEQWTAACKDWSMIRYLRIREPAADRLPFGFHQLWNVRAAAIRGRQPLVSEAFPTAAAVDYHWYRLWPADKRVMLPPDQLSIVHRWHGPFSARWHNRGIPPGGWEWIGQVCPLGPLWFLAGKQPRYPAELRLIDLDTEQSEIVTLPTDAALRSHIGRRVVDVYARLKNRGEHGPSTATK